jgi:isopentenyl diphosphate isomerase/L-lactate dehydrogenase-like FMN-dependent dehydrogenase
MSATFSSKRRGRTPSLRRAAEATHRLDARFPFARSLARSATTGRTSRLQRAYNVSDVRELARRRVPTMAFDFVDGAAGDELTMAANDAAFARVGFSPRALRDVRGRDLRTTVLGTPVAFPVILGPTGGPALQHADGELAAARAAHRAGTVLTVSTAASHPLEDIRRAAHGPVWFQLYATPDDRLTEHMISRAEAAGCCAMLVTVDAAVSGPHERDLRNGWGNPPRLTPANVQDALRHPARLTRWARAIAGGPVARFGDAGDYARRQGGAAPIDLCNDGQTWEHLERLRARWQAPLAVKGIMTAADAVRARECGVDAVVVSNHGGRQLDGLPATLEVLPEIVAALAGDGVQVLMDGGVRRGADVVKALALGADACLVARPWVWGLAAAGEAGVDHVLEILRTELDRTLALLGVRSVEEIDRSLIRLP